MWDASLKDRGLVRQQRRYTMSLIMGCTVWPGRCCWHWMTRRSLVGVLFVRGLTWGWSLDYSYGDCEMLTAGIMCFVSIVSVYQSQQKNKRKLLLLFHWPGSKSSHTGSRGRCPGGYEVTTAGLLHFGSDPLRWTHLADEPWRTTGGSGTPLSRSEDPTRPRTACGLPQQRISWAQRG